METLLFLLENPGVLRAEHDGCNPLLVRQDEILTLYVEGVAIASWMCTDEMWQEDGLLAWALAYYIFNLKVGKGAANTNWLLREKVLGLRTETTVGGKLLETVQELERAIK